MKQAPPWITPARAWSLDGRVLEVQCPPVLDLVPLLLSPAVYVVLSTLTAPADQAWVAERVIPRVADDDEPDDDGLLLPRADIGDALLARIADALVWTWCGVPRWFAANLWEEAAGNWVNLDGHLLSRGVDLTALPALRATTLVWSTLRGWHAQDKDKGSSWRARIEAPPAPPRRVVRPPKSAPARESRDREDADNFMSVFAAVGGRAR